MKKKTKTLILSVVVTLILLLTFTVSYAIFAYQETGLENNQLVMGDIWMSYNESNGIDLSGAMPGDDYSEYFEFTIRGKNTYTEKDIWYDVILSRGDVPEGKTEDNRILDKYLNFKLVEVNEDLETIIFTDKTYSDINGKRIHVEVIPKNQVEEYNKTYRLYMIINDELTLGNTTSSVMTVEDYQKAFASVKVSVTGDFEEKELPIEYTPESYFEYREVEGGVSITNYDESCGTDVVIPKTINDLDVLIIDGWWEIYEGGYHTGAMQSKNLTSVVIPNTVTTITEFAFYNNQLTNVEIPDSVTRIGIYAFSNNLLTSVEIPNSVTTIGSDAFSNNQLTSIEIPESVTSLGVRAFSNNKVVEGELFIYDRTDLNGDGVAEIDKTSINSYVGASKNLIIPDGITVIGYDVFRFLNLASVEISDSVTTIEQTAFSDNLLTNIMIPKNVTTIGYDAFSNNQLASVTIGSGIQYINREAFQSDGSSNPNLESITFTSKTCEEIKNIQGSSTDTTKYFPWLYFSNPYYVEGYKATIIGTDGECSY